MQKQQNSRDNHWTIIKILEWTTSYFKAKEVESPRASAEIILAFSLGVNRIDLYLQYDRPLNDSELKYYKSLISRRVQKEPVAYITGKKEFWSLDIAVTREVLIPRPETEFLVETAVACLDEDRGSVKKQVLELGTGSGAVILALASERPENVYFASDYSVNAVKVAKDNAERLGVDQNILFFCSDWFDSLSLDLTRFDAVLSNPPYIPTLVIPGLQPEIHRYEPTAALDGGMDGLNDLKSLIHSAVKYLNPHGSLILEIGHDQKEAVKDIADQCGFYKEVVFIKDYSGIDRVVHLRGNGESDGHE